MKSLFIIFMGLFTGVNLAHASMEETHKELEKFYRGLGSSKPVQQNENKPLPSSKEIKERLITKERQKAAKPEANGLDLFYKGLVPASQDRCVLRVSEPRKDVSVDQIQVQPAPRVHKPRTDMFKNPALKNQSTCILREFDPRKDKPFANIPVTKEDDQKKTSENVQQTQKNAFNPNGIFERFLVQKQKRLSNLK